MNARFLQMDAATLERELANVIAAYPEMAEDDELRADTFEGMGLNDLLSRLISAAQDAGTLSDAIKSRIDGMAKRRQASDRREEAFRALILKLMQSAGLPKVQLPEATLSIAKVPPSVIVTDEAAIPEHCIRTKLEIDKKAIKERLEAGADVPGAALSNGGVRLNVRVA